MEGIMPAATGLQRQVEPTSVNIEEHTLEARIKDFECEACGYYKVSLTARESWYVCVNCGYGFGIEPHPKKHLRRATDVDVSGSISH